jgi:class 3 adenylate cyclase
MAENKSPEEKKEAIKSKKKKKRGTRISLGFKFSFFVGLLMAGILVAITVFIYNQEKDALSYEVTQRGTAVALNLASSSIQPLLDNDDLVLMSLAFDAVQKTEGGVVPEKKIYPSKAEELFYNVADIFQNQIMTKKEKPYVKNEGIFEAYIVKTDEKTGDMTIVSAHDRSYFLQPYTRPAGTKPIAEAMKKGDQAAVQKFTKDGKNYFDVAVPIQKIFKVRSKGSDVAEERQINLGEVHLSISEDIIANIVLVAAVKLVFITLGSLIAGIILSLMLVNFLTNPIKFLMQGVRAIGEGNYDVAIKVKTRDELGELSAAFNSTAKSLKEKELLKGAFSTYVSSTVMEQILKDPGKLSLHGTRVRCTMLFTDIRGFTSMSETLEPEQVVSVINEYLTLQTDKVFKWEGLLDKFVGDCVMAVYGLPFPKQDDAYRAVRTAMDMRDGLEKLNVIRKKRDQIVVGVGIGINTGDVVAGNMGSPQKMDYTVIGDNVNLAARLEANAPAGKIFVSESTYNDTKDRIEYEQLESISVKGKKEPVKVYSPVRVKDMAPPPAGA